MNEEAMFLLDVLAHPDDDGIRLIYADWLEDHDDPRGEWIRLDCELRGAARRDFLRERASACQVRGWYLHDGLVLTAEQLALLFRMRLAETIAFCSGRDLPLRRWDLDPRTLIGWLSNQGWPHSDEIDWLSMVSQVAIARRRLLERDGRLPSRPANGISGGRLLLFDPWVAISFGEAMTYSGAYFDVDNLPPWDTWVMQIPEPSPVERYPPRRITPHYLVAWVPAAFVQRAASGIETNDEGSLRWLSEIDTPFVQALRNAGIRP